MICIYSQNNTNYEANGDAVLEPISCDLEITINGAWSLTLEHPYDPEGKYKYIVEGAVIRADIRCIRELTGIRQRFRIYDYKKGLHSVTAIAFPVAMEATYDAPVKNLVIENKTGIQAMSDIQRFTDKYTLTTDITRTATSSFGNTNVNSIIASGSSNCFIKVWGGEILYDNLTFNVKNRIGDTEAGSHQITYGRNLTDITYTKDDSGLVTRLYPISKDGIRLHETTAGEEYVDSPKISDYPIVHSKYIQAPYNLIDTDFSNGASETKDQTSASGTAVYNSARTLTQAAYNTALAAGYEPEYIKENRNSLIEIVTNHALGLVWSTSLYNYFSQVIESAMRFLEELEQPAWDWMGSWENGWKYGNESGYAVSRYVKIGKTWSYFNAEGYWEEPKDDSGTWDWYQAQADTGRRYGNFTHYYAHNEYVYITMSGTLTKYYFDSDGWYDDSKTEASTWDWRGSGTAEDPYWFGESDATSEDSNKYAHDCWLFIDGSLYFFDHFGYYTPGNKFDDYQWDWVETSDGFWFGNAIDQTYGAVYLKSQWTKINGDWIYFDSNGYAIQENASLNNLTELFWTETTDLQTVVEAQKELLVNLLDSLMIQYANSQFNSGIDIPAVTITVDMADLSKTTEYEGFEDLESVKLGDAVICTDNEHNISMTSRVVGLTYDCIRDFNSTVVIGKAGASISSIVGNANSEVVSGGFDTSAIESQIAALQGKVGDIFMNDASIVSNGVGRFSIQAGDNISISRSGNVLTISAQVGGGTGNVSLYHGIYDPDSSIGQNNDIYLKMAPGPSDIKGLIVQGNGGAAFNNLSLSPDTTNKIQNVDITFFDSWEYHSYAIFTHSGITMTAGKKYRMSFTMAPQNTPSLYDSDELYGITVQTGRNFIDGRNITGIVKNGALGYYPDTYYGTFYYQSFFEDAASHTYTFDFTAQSSTLYFGLYGDRVKINDLQMAVTGWTLMELGEGDEIIDAYYKLDNEWIPYEGKDYLKETNKPQINGVELTGNKTSSDLHISEVTANGSGTASEDLTKLEVNSTIYNVQNLPLTVQDGKLCIIYDNGQ